MARFSWVATRDNSTDLNSYPGLQTFCSSKDASGVSARAGDFWPRKYRRIRPRDTVCRVVRPHSVLAFLLSAVLDCVILGQIYVYRKK